MSMFVRRVGRENVRLCLSDEMHGREIPVHSPSKITFLLQLIMEGELFFFFL